MLSLNLADAGGQVHYWQLDVMNFLRKDASHPLVSMIQFIQYVCVHLFSFDYAWINCSTLPDLNDLHPESLFTISNFPQRLPLPEVDFTDFVSIS